MSGTWRGNAESLRHVAADLRSIADDLEDLGDPALGAMAADTLYDLAERIERVAERVHRGADLSTAADGHPGL